jgi:hypothetical protein
VGTVSVSRTVPGPLAGVQARWYLVDEWPRWVDGLERIEGVEGDWPGAGAVVRWTSRPLGRGAVRELVLDYEPGAGQTLEVCDESIDGTQAVSFTEVPEGVEIELALNYRLRSHPVLMLPVDLLFVRRAMRASLRATLDAFGLMVEEEGV